MSGLQSIRAELVRKRARVPEDQVEEIEDEAGDDPASMFAVPVENSSLFPLAMDLAPADRRICTEQMRARMGRLPIALKLRRAAAAGQKEMVFRGDRDPPPLDLWTFLLDCGYQVEMRISWK